MSRANRIRCVWIFAAFGLGLSQWAASARHEAPLSILRRPPDRACLDGFVDRYLEAMGHNDAARLPWAKGALLGKQCGVAGR